MTDRDILRKIMYLKEWTQTQLANELGFNQSNISRIVHGLQTLSLGKREQVEDILEDAEKHRTPAEWRFGRGKT